MSATTFCPLKSHTTVERFTPSSFLIGAAMKRCIPHLPSVADAAMRRRHKRLNDALTVSDRLGFNSSLLPHVTSGSQEVTCSILSGFGFLPAGVLGEPASCSALKTPGKSQGFHPWAQAPDNQPPHFGSLRCPTSELRPRCPHSGLRESWDSCSLARIVRPLSL